MLQRRSFLLFGAAALVTALAPDVEARPHRKRRPDPRRTTLPSLRGSPDALAREHEMARRAGLRRFGTRDDIRHAIADGTLVTITGGRTWRIDPELGENDTAHRVLYQHALPCVRAFMRMTVAARPKRIRDRYLVTSLVRSDEYQARIRRRGNPNAVQDSSHCYGATVDFRTTNLSREGLTWMRQWLAGLERDGLVQATEEVRNGAFHVAVRVDIDNRD